MPTEKITYHPPKQHQSVNEFLHSNRYTSFPKDGASVVSSVERVKVECGQCM